MNKTNTSHQTPSIGLGIVLSLALSACTGFGVQTGPTLTSQIAEEQVLGNLWGEKEAEGPNGQVALAQDDHEHDEADLWIEAAQGQSDWNGYGDELDATPRADRVLERLTLKDSVLISYDDMSGVTSR